MFFQLIFGLHSSDRSSINDITRNSNKVNKQPSAAVSTIGSKREIACQTLSTGDIVMMKVHFEEDKNHSGVLMSSPKKEK